MELRTRLEAALRDHYAIERELGGGGMSRVFLAMERQLERRVVIKVLAEDVAALLSTTRFEREIRLAASLQQANIVPVLTAGVVDDVPYFTMPFVEGESLRARLAAGPLPEAQVIQVLRDVTRALAYAHERSVIHRDIKPDNILLSGDAAVVTDFGIAKAITEARATPQPNATGLLTQAGTAIGTPAYMAPEQAAADPAMDHRADLYALGCTAYELLTGRPPFADLPPHKLLAAHLMESPPAVASLRPGMDPALAALVTACMAKDPEDRPATARALLQQVEAIGSSASRQAVPYVLGTRQRTLPVAVAQWGAAFGASWILAKAAVVGIGLPSWTVPLVLTVAGLGLPMVLVTWYVQRTARAALLKTPAYTPSGGTVVRGTVATMALKASPHLSWRRTRSLSLAAGALVVLAIAAVMVLRSFGIGPAASLLAAGRIGADSRLLVAQFRTTASDTSLASVVAEALRTSLAQSKAIRLVSAGEVAAGLRRMTLPVSTPLTDSTARELAMRDGIPLIVRGTVAPIGAGFLVTAELVRADSGTVLTSVQQAADGASGLLSAIDGLARELRSRIGESLRAVAQAPALEDATTASLTALREYTRGVQLGDIQGDFTEGAAHLRAAVREDSTFASAWRKLAVYVFNMDGSRSEQLRAAAQAYRFRERVTGVERAQIEAYYLEQVNTRAGSAIYAATPGLSQNNQIILLRTQGRFAEAESVVLGEFRAIEAGTRPRIIQLYVQRIGVHLVLDQREAAQTTLAEMITHFPSAYYTDLGRAWVGWYLGGPDSLPRLAAEASRSAIPATRALSAKLEASLSAMRGQLRRYRTLAGRADLLGDSAKSGSDPVGTAIEVATTSAVHGGRRDEGIRALDSLRAATPERDVDPLDGHALDLAVAYALLNAPAKAQPLVDEFLGRASPDARLYRWGELHSALGEIALAQGKPADALAAFRRAAMADSGKLENQAVSRWHERLGRAHDAMGQRDSAVAHFEIARRRRDGSGYTAAGLYYAGMLRRLGALYQDAGEVAKARACFEGFIALWRDADPELQPQVADVRARLAALPAR
jgi:tetratricopeptide (TPR) repeat protein